MCYGKSLNLRLDRLFQNEGVLKFSEQIYKKITYEREVCIINRALLSSRHIRQKQQKQNFIKWQHLK